MSVDSGSSGAGGNLSLFEPEDESEPVRRQTRTRRSARPEVQARRARRRRLRGRIIPLIALAIIVVVIVSGYTIVRHFVDGFAVKDYKGSGTGNVLVHVPEGSTTGEIASVMVKADVVASTKAFINAAGSKQFQAGYFKMRHEMSGKSAVALLLLPSTRQSTKVTFPEGLIEPVTLARLASSLHLPIASLRRAAANLHALGLPAGFGITGKTAEGFLFPSTYQFPPRVTASDALIDMTGLFGQKVRSLNFVAAARRLHYTPYQALIIASIVEAEANNDADRPKVAEVIYNRLKLKHPLQSDATSAYGAKLAGTDPVHINYHINTPYNTRNTPGLPPTPIGNPGAPSMTAAIHPAVGNYLYFVSKDKAGHLFFTNSYPAFLTASAKCKAQRWGCV